MRPRWTRCDLRKPEGCAPRMDTDSEAVSPREAGAGGRVLSLGEPTQTVWEQFRLHRLNKNRPRRKATELPEQRATRHSPGNDKGRNPERGGPGRNPSGARRNPTREPRSGRPRPPQRGKQTRRGHRHGKQSQGGGGTGRRQGSKATETANGGAAGRTNRSRRGFQNGRPPQGPTHHSSLTSTMLERQAAR